MQYDVNGLNVPAAIFNSTSNDFQFLKIFDWRAFEGNMRPLSTFQPYGVYFFNNISLLVSSFAAVGVLVCIGLSLYFHHNRLNPVVKKASPVFFQLMLFGIALLYLTVIVWAIDASQYSCFFHAWLPVLGFTLIMSNLLAKTYRIWKIFHNVKMTTLVITDRALLKFTALTLFINIGLLLGYTFVDGLPRDALRFVPELNGFDTVYVGCTDLDTFGRRLFVGLLFGFNIAMVLLGCIAAYLTRKVDSSFNESRFIGFAMYSILVTAVVVVPIYVTAVQNANAVLKTPVRLYTIRSLAFLVFNTFTMITLFVPKVVAVHKKFLSDRHRFGEDEPTVDSVTNVEK